MSHLTIGQVHNSYIQPAITNLREKLGELSGHIAQLQSSPRVSTNLTQKSTDRAQIRIAIHTYAGLVDNLFRTSVNHWVALSAAAIPHLSPVETCSLDSHLSDVVALRWQFRELCVGVNPFLAAYDEELDIPPGEGEDDGREEWVSLLEHRLNYYHEELESLDELVEDLDDVTGCFRSILEDLDNASSGEDEPMFDFGYDEGLIDVTTDRRKVDQRVGTWDHRREIKECVAAVDRCLSRVRYWELVGGMEFLGEEDRRESWKEIKDLAGRAETLRGRFSAFCQALEAGMNVCRDRLRG
ncbi:hypothetical protein DFP73DRAFT_524748 [Morchella snyderi]|nr:hypothetical protein DFP73DRAFT_524748 [Morchella snyderi]